MEFIRTNDRRRIARFLCTKPVVYAYPLAYLDPGFDDFTLWYASVDDDGEYNAVVLVYVGLSRPALFTCGMPDLVAPLVDRFADEFPLRVTARLRNHHWDAVLKVFRTPDHQRELTRMALSKRSYTAFRPDAVDVERVERLGHRDTAEIIHLHAHWPNRFFEPAQLDTGLVYGIREEGARRLISMGVVHNISDTYDIASISTLVTHPEHRRKGLSRIVTAKLLDACFDRVSLVTLDIGRHNDVARRAYGRFGFRPIREFQEAALRK